MSIYLIAEAAVSHAGNCIVLKRKAANLDLELGTAAAAHVFFL